MHTQVAIVGAGPAGLLLAHLLDEAGIASVVLEQRSRLEVETTIRAGVLEQGTVDLLRAHGLAARLQVEGAVHAGIELRFDGRRHRVPLAELTGGRTITVYAQHEVLKDLIAARVAAEAAPLFESRVTGIHCADSARPLLSFERNGASGQVRCDFVVGCDGFHGLVRQAIPLALRREYQAIHPFGWFGILLEAPRLSPELVYTRHARGFALVSTRSETLQRLYFQCEPDERITTWSDDRILAELARRLETRDGPVAVHGRVVQRDLVAMRSFVCETMRHGRLLLAGDAAHIVPPTGAKGLNLAVNDVRLLAEALGEFYRAGRETGLQQYPARCLARVWRAQRFSVWMTHLLHRAPDDDPYRQRLQLAELDHVVGSRSAAAALAEDYVG